MAKKNPRDEMTEEYKQKAHSLGQAGHDHEDFSDIDPNKLTAEHPIDFLNKVGVKHDRGVVRVPHDRARDTRRLVAVGKMGPAFGRSDWKGLDPSFQWRKEGSMKSEHAGETELWSSKRPVIDLHPF